MKAAIYLPTIFVWEKVWDTTMGALRYVWGLFYRVLEGLLYLAG